MNTSFTHPKFADHERMVFVNDKAVGLQAIIAVHNTQRGPAIGGCRMWPYERQIQKHHLPVPSQVFYLSLISASFGWLKEGLLKQLIEVVL